MTHELTSHSTGFQAHCLAEAVRLKESGWGPLEDTAEVRRAIANGGSSEERLLFRAQLLAQREGWATAYQHLQQVLRWLLPLVLVLAVVAGLSAVWGVLGVGSTINIITAVVGLVGLNVLTLLFWLASFFMAKDSAKPGSLLGKLSLKLLARVARGEANTLVLGAGVNVVARHKLGRWVSGLVSHTFWVWATLVAILALLWALSARRYGFGWETTLLSDGSFVVLVESLGSVPRWLGFDVPSAELIRLSNGLNPLTVADQRVWSSWLLGCLVCYGLLPRVLAWVVSALVMRYRLRHLQLDRQLPGWVEQQERLFPVHVRVGVDAEAPADYVAAVQPTVFIPPSPSDTVCVVAVEYPSDRPWPPHTLPTRWMDAGVVDTRAEREQLLQRLLQQSPDYLVVVCDAGQTPDRGVVAWLGELSSYGRYCAVALQLEPDGTVQPERLEAWRNRLGAAGFKAEQVHINVQSLFPSSLTYE